MASKRLTIQDQPAEVRALRWDDQYARTEREKRRDDKERELSIGGLNAASERNNWARDEDVRNDAVTRVEWTHDGWHVRWIIARNGDALVPRALELEPVDLATPPGGITADMLRSLSPSRAVAAAADTSGLSEIETIIKSWHDRIRDKHGPAEQPAQRRPGRPRIEDDELAEIAVAYLEEAKAGAGLHQRLSDRFQVAPSTVRDRIYMCRERGFLTPTKQGQRGAEAGPALRERLTQQAIVAPTTAEGDG